MISIIICSIKPDLLKSVKTNILETIGIKHEIIVINNNIDRLSICQAYNYGASKAKYTNLVFCHEDILFYTSNWGQILIEILNDTGVGLIGVAGATFKSKYPLSWVSINPSYYRSNAFFDKPEVHKDKNINTLEEVAVVDGMFLSMSKDVWSKHEFNEKELKSFHLYDIDMSYQLFLAGYKIVVSNQISVQHLSKGSLDIDWFKASVNWHKNKNLPIYSLAYPEEEIIKIEKESQARYLNHLIKFEIDIKKWYREYIIFCKNKKSLNLRVLLRILKGWSQISQFKIIKSLAFLRKSILNHVLFKRVNNSNICIVANNCWAGDVYEAINKKYNTPFVGLFFNAPCYIKLLENFDFYMGLELNFLETSKYPISNINYPIGSLNNDVEIHFLHCKSEEEAFEKWNRRKNRMPKNINNYLYKMDDRDFATEQEILAFHNLDYPNKISFTKEKYDFENNLKLKSKDDLILLYTTYELTDLSIFINTGKVKNTLYNKIISTFIKYPSKWL